MDQNFITIENHKGIEILYCPQSNSFIANLFNLKVKQGCNQDALSFPSSNSLVLSRALIDNFLSNSKFDPLKKALYYFISRGGFSSISSIFVKTFYDIGNKYVFVETVGNDKYPSTLTLKPNYEDDENKHFLFDYDEDIMNEITENETIFQNACKYRNQRYSEIAAKLLPFNTMIEN